VVSKLSNEYVGRLTVAHIDVRTNTEKAKEYGVDGVPMSFFFVDGSPVKVIRGSRSYEAMKAETDGVLESPKE